MFISDTLHSPSPNALEPPLESLLLDRSAPDVCAMDKFTRLCMLFLHPTTYHHHPVRGRGYHLEHFSWWLSAQSVTTVRKPAQSVPLADSIERLSYSFHQSLLRASLDAA